MNKKFVQAKARFGSGKNDVYYRIYPKGKEINATNEIRIQNFPKLPRYFEREDTASPCNFCPASKDEEIAKILFVRFIILNDLIGLV